MTPIDEDDERYTISYGERPPNYAKNDFESVYSTLHFNIDQWPGGKLDRIIDNANYTCQSRSWQVSSLQTDGVTSTTYFRVECKLNTYYVHTALYIDTLKVFLTITKVSFTVLLHKQLITLQKFNIPISIDISIKTHHFVCIRQAYPA